MTWAISSRAPAGYEFLAAGHLGVMTLRRGHPERERVLCFPFGGGGPLSFRGLASHLPETWSVRAVDPPGHLRARGKPLRSVDDMCDLYARSIAARWLRDSLLVGHSLGGYVALTLAARLEEEGTPARGVVVGAALPPHLINPARPLSRLTDDELFRWLIGLREMAEPIAEERQLFDLYRDAIRADIEAYESFQFRGGPFSRTPLLICGALDDRVCTPARLHEWRRFAHVTTFDFVAGGHLFVVSRPAAFAERLQVFARSLPPSLDEPDENTRR